MSYKQTSIGKTIMDALQVIFTNELQILPDDDLSLVTCHPAPLQADPTAVAPYLIWASAPELGRKMLKDPRKGGFAIGGPVMWQGFWKGVCGVPRQSSREDAIAAIEELSTRVEECVTKHYDLSDVLAPGRLASEDGSEWVDAMNPEDMWVRTVPKIFGGDTEWYGQALMIWSYNSARTPKWRG